MSNARSAFETSPRRRRVGSYIATARLQAFGGRSVQKIETWDTKDELVADMIASRLLTGDRPSSIAHLGDDAQLLAGTTLAAMTDPSRHDGITAALQVALGELPLGRVRSRA